MARLTYKRLAQLVSDKLKDVQHNHRYVVASRTHYRGHDYEGGAATINYFVYYNDQDFALILGFQWRHEIEVIINKESYTVEVKQSRGGDWEIEFKNR